MLKAPTRRELVLSLAAAGLLAPRLATAAGRGLEFNSPYNFVYIEKEGSLVSFNYSLVPGRLSAIDLARPAYQVVPYTRYYYAADLVRPRPRKVLMAGLGAGGFNRLFNLIYPTTPLLSVEIDPMILRLAEEHAGFRRTPTNEVVLDDARIYLRRSRDTFDWILMDAFDRDAQIPVHLTTREFYQSLADRLAPDGVLLTNLHQGTRFFAAHVETIRAVFPSVLLIPVATRSNLILLAGKRPGLSLPSRADALARNDYVRYQANGVDLGEIVQRSMVESDYLPQLGEKRQVLTDDFAPVESLARQPLPLVEPRPS